MWKVCGKQKQVNSRKPTQTTKTAQIRRFKRGFGSLRLKSGRLDSREEKSL